MFHINTDINVAILKVLLFHNHVHSTNTVTKYIEKKMVYFRDS
jgi:hypothetical protein